MTATINVLKYDGTLEPFNIDKVYKVIAYASKGLKGISSSQLAINLDIQLYDGISTDLIQKNLIEVAHNQINLEAPDYEILAARLLAFQQRKQAFKKFEPPKLLDFVRSMVDRGRYDSAILDSYSEDEFQRLDGFIRHSRDLDFRYAGMKQLQEKCLAKDKKGNTIETPQFMYMLIPMYFFMEIKDKDARLNTIIGYYETTSTGLLSHPTPVNDGVRTHVKQFSSCVKFDVDCKLGSQLYAYYALGKYTSQRAGIGLNVGRIRAHGDKIQGAMTHPGPFAFLRVIESVIKNTSQGKRGGAATVYFPFWHRDAMDMLMLKNNRGDDSNRIRHLDYNIQFNRLFYRRYLKGGMLSLFSPEDARDLYEAFFRDNDEFEAMYEALEADKSIPRKTVSAKEMMDRFVVERGQTGRIYAFNADHVNDHGSFDSSVAPIYMSNLCVEITLPTKPIQGFEDVDSSEVALCTLAAVNLGKVDRVEDLERPLYYAVRGLDELLDYQEYPIPQTEYWAKKRRSLGVGVVGYAHFLAKRGLMFGEEESLRETHRYFEAFQFYLIKASMELAKEKGPCELFHETKYAKGIMPVDTYCKGVDKICDEPLHMDWDWLRAEVVKHGMRHSTLSALMPSETSSQVVQSTDGINQPKSALIIKGAKDSSKRQIVPDYEVLGDKYDYKFGDMDNKRILRAIAVMQKFIDQSISTNTSYNPLLYPNRKVPASVVIGDILYAYSLGIKTLYYHYTKVDDSMLQATMSDFEETVMAEEKDKESFYRSRVADEEEGCEGGACSI